MSERLGAGGGLVSVVVPVYGSEDILPHTYDRLHTVLAGLAPEFDYEIVFVDDGSPDGSLGVLRGLAAQDPRVRVLALSRNFGHQTALTAGVDHARGDAVISIDDDLQDPPELIREMLDLWRAGNKVVYGVRAAREGESLFKRTSAKLFYRLIRRLSDTELPLDSGDFRLMDRVVVDALSGMREESRYVRGMVSWLGFRQAPLSYERDARFAGKGHYTLPRLMKLSFDGIFSFTSRPLALSTQFGMVLTALSAVAALAIVTERLLSPTPVAPGWTSVIVAVLFMGGVQLVSIGVLGAYVSRIFYESKKRPLYVVAERLNLADLPVCSPTGGSTATGD